MAFHEGARFPTNISHGSRGGPGFNTNIVELDGGQESSLPRWSEGRHSFNAAYGIKNTQMAYAVRKFYQARLGCANGFRYKDWDDYTTNATDGNNDTTTSVDQECIRISDTVFQMAKNYTDGGVTRVRRIFKPVSGTVSVAVDAVTAGSGFTVNYAAGLITFSSAVDSDSVVTWGGEFDVAARFGKEIDGSLETTVDDFGIRSIADIPIIELMDPGPSTDDFFFGGSVELCIADNYTMSVMEARLYAVKMTASGKAMLLPAGDSIPPGGPVFYVVNIGTNSFDLKTGSTVLATLAAGKMSEVTLGLDGSDDPIWYAND